MKAASATDSVGDNSAFTTFQCSSMAGRQCTTKTSWRAKYLGDQTQMAADGISFGDDGVTLERCTLACEKAADCKVAVWFADDGLCFPTNAASDEVQPGDYNAASFTTVFCGAPTAPVKAPIHGMWSDWTASGSCSANCGDGLQTYTRTCTPPAHGGDDCSGDATKTESCKLKECPVHGSWSAWAEQGSCSADCGDGLQTYTRTCTPPAHGG